MLPQENFLMFQPLRLFLVASEHSDGENLSAISTGSPPFQVKCCKDVGYVLGGGGVGGVTRPPPPLKVSKAAVLLIFKP